MLLAATACTFSTSQLPKVVRDRRVLPLFTSKCASHALFPHLIFQKRSENGVFCNYIFTSKCASRHNGVQFFICHLASYLRTRRCSEPTFRPSGATNHWKKHSVSRLSYLSRTCIFSLRTFSISELLPSWPAFSSLHIVGSLASKLPSMIYMHLSRL